MACYYCRICNNNLGWARPAGVTNSVAINPPVEGAYGYEEWLADSAPAALYGGYKYGWLEPYNPATKPGYIPTPAIGQHDVILYTHDPHWFVGIIKNCERIPDGTVPRNDFRTYHRQMQRQLRLIPFLAAFDWPVIDRLVDNHWPNMRFRPADLTGWVPFAIPAGHPAGSREQDHYWALEADCNGAEWHETLAQAVPLPRGTGLPVDPAYDLPPR